VSHNLRIFDAAWKAVDRNYYDREARRKDWTAIGASARPLAAEARDDVDLYLNILWPMLQRLGDSHFSAIPPSAPNALPAPAQETPLAARPEEALPQDTRAPTRGLGFTYHFARGGIWIVDVAKDSPLDQAALEPGDAISEMRIGPPKVDGAQFEGVFERAGGGTVKVAYLWIPETESPTASRRLPSGRLLLRFDAFDAASADWVIDQLRSAPSEGVLLDLRRNSGGRSLAEHRVLGALLGPDLTMGVNLDGRRRVQRSMGTKVYAGPLAVLVGANSASAAEASAAALRYHGRAIIVGQRTAGALLVSRDFRLPGGGSIQIPVADYFTPSGERLEGQGVVPDREVRPTLAAIRAERDLVVEAAEAALDEKPLAARAEDDSPIPTARSSPRSPGSPRRWCCGRPG
jgi:carboxyl-terminal processing protease